MANILPLASQEQVLRLLVEGNSIRAIERIAGVHRDTVMRLLRRVAPWCQRAMNLKMRNLKIERIQLDEIWTFVAKKQRRLNYGKDESKKGDFWIHVALDPDSKLIPSYRVGKRTKEDTYEFLDDLSCRIEGRIQISSDQRQAYIKAVARSFGERADFGQIVKFFATEHVGPGRYSPPKVSYCEKHAIQGDPESRHISTSLVERHNLTMRMGMRRLTRLTNGFSKSVENLQAAVDLHMAYYNFCRPHKTLGSTPAHAAGVTSKPWTLAGFVHRANMPDAWQAAKASRPSA